MLQSDEAFKESECHSVITDKNNTIFKMAKKCNLISILSDLHVTSYACFLSLYL